MDQEGWKDASAASAAAMSAHGYLACHVITGFTATIHKSRPVKEFTFSQLGCGDQRSQESQRLLICALAKLSLLFFLELPSLPSRFTRLRNQDLASRKTRFVSGQVAA